MYSCYYTQACHQVVFIRFFFVKMHADESFNIRTCFLFLGIFVIDCQTCSVYSSCAEMKGPCFILYFCVPFWFQIPLRRFRQVSCSLYILNVLGLFIIVIFFWLFPSIHLCCPFYWVFLVKITLMQCMAAIRNANVYRTVALIGICLYIHFFPYPLLTLSVLSLCDVR